MGLEEELEPGAWLARRADADADGAVDDVIFAVDDAANPSGRARQLRLAVAEPGCLQPGWCLQARVRHRPGSRFPAPSPAAPLIESLRLEAGDACVMLQLIDSGGVPRLEHTVHLRWARPRPASALPASAIAARD